MQSNLQGFSLLVECGHMWPTNFLGNWCYCISWILTICFTNYRNHNHKHTRRMHENLKLNISLVSYNFSILWIHCTKAIWLPLYQGGTKCPCLCLVSTPSEANNKERCLQNDKTLMQSSILPQFIISKGIKGPLRL